MSLPHLKPTRTKEQGTVEVEFYAALEPIWDKTLGRIKEVAGLGQGRKAVTRWWWGAEQRARLHQVAVEYLDGVAGTALPPSPGTLASLAVMTAPLVTFWERSHDLGIEQGRELLGLVQEAIGASRAGSVQKLVADGFDRLTEGSRLKLGDFLEGTGYPGGSVREVLERAFTEGATPIEAGRDLAARWDGFEQHEFERLCRTEVAFAQIRGKVDEWRAAGYTLQGVVADEQPPFHPHCVCDLTLDPETGLVFYDIAPSACEVCQAMLLQEAA